MKTRCLPILLVLLPLAALSAQNEKMKIAVLSVATSEKIGESILLNVPEAIIEELLNSRYLTLVDRTSLGDALKEIEQVVQTDLFKPEDVQKAASNVGKGRGADYVVSIKISYSPQDETYVLSAKIVKLDGLEIIAQASDKQKGTPTVLLDVAHRVGVKLNATITRIMTGQVESGSAPVKEEPKTTTGAAATGTAGTSTGGTKTPPAPGQASGPKARITANYVVPIFGGDIQDAMDKVSVGDASSTSGFALHYFQPLFLGIYVSAALDYTSMNLDTTTKTYSSHSVLDFQAGTGWSFAPTNWMQFYTGVMAGWGSLTLGDYWVMTDSYGTVTEHLSGLTASGLCLSFEIGADVILADHWTVATRIAVTSADFSSGDIYTRKLFKIGSATATGLVYTGIHIGAGYAF